jgi:hypothetical protein
VRSAYHLKQQIKVSQAGRARPSINYDDHQGWLLLWEADVPAKVKIHGWCLARNGLAVGKELRRRRIKEGVCCVAGNTTAPLLGVSVFGTFVEHLEGKIWSALGSAS